MAERRRRIVAELQRRGAAHIEELASALDVSSMTVRRDIDALAAEGLVAKTRGGVLLQQGASRPRSSADLAENLAEKAAVANEAAKLVRPGMVVGLAAGSTVGLIAPHLRSVEGLTVVTNSVPIADQLASPDRADLPDPSVVLTGGLRTPTGALVGPVAVRALEDLHCDVVFLSGNGLAPETGLTTPNLLEAETNRALVDSGRRTVVLIDHTKWRQVSLATIVDLDAVDAVVVDGAMDSAAVDELRSFVPEVHLAPIGD